MIAIDWLGEYAPGFRGLPDDERIAITDFCSPWNLFEAKVLNQNGSANAIVEAAKVWAGNGLLNKEIFKRQVDNFRNCYFADGEYAYHFNHLRLRQNDSHDLAKEVLRNVDANPDEVAAALLIIVYRFRNNLFMV